MGSQRNTFVIYFSIIVLAAVCVFSYKVWEDEALDLGRYYKQAEIDVKLYDSIFDFIHSQIILNGDFIYFTALYSASRTGIPLSFVTIFFLSLYCISAYGLINISYRINEFKNIYIIFVLTLCPIIWILTISRTTAALSFFFLGCLFLKKNQRKKAYLLYIIAIFTHISMILFILLVLVSHSLSKLRFRKTRSYILLCIALVGYMIPTIIMDIISPYITLIQSRYAYYAEMEMQSPLFASSLGIGDKVPIIFIYALQFYLLIKDKRTDWTFWMLYICWSMLSFFIWSDMMMTNRIIMLSVPFVGISFYHLLSCSKNRKKLQIISCLGILIAIGSLYTYRTVF